MQYKPGATIFKQGDTESTFYVITSGVVCLNVDGQEVGRLERSKLFGERAIIADELRAATVTAGPDGADVLAISREAFNVRRLPESCCQSGGRRKAKSGAACAKKGASTRRMQRPAELVPTRYGPLMRRAP